VALRFTFRGTHQGEFISIAPTGKQVTIPGIDIFRVADGKIVELWGQEDMLGMMQQLGPCASARSRSLGWAWRRGCARVKNSTLWAKRAAFYALVALCLMILSGWTQQVLEDFEEGKGAASSAKTGCGGDGSGRELSQS
jgi:hypothetical protein